MRHRLHLLRPAAAMLALAAAASAAPVDFGREVLPILSEHCFTCHGPDAAARQADLRLDLREGALADRGGYAAVTPGDAEKSELVARVLAEDESMVMPPPEAKRELSAAARQTLVRWVEEGASWGGHWAFERPGRPDRPDSAENPVDGFIRQKLAERGLTPAPSADRRTLLRRVALDLTGLPPSAEEIDAFLADAGPDAYERAVDRLLASDAHAEWLTLDWLDTARYADSHGLHADGIRTSWPWRDWVIRAFRANMPYDRFVTLQLAGDLLPQATREDRLATAFLRNHPMTGEGGVIDEEFRWNYVFDRTETVGTAVLGVTLQCCRCHDHKFDPISQREYFEFAAFFDKVRELGMTGDDGDYGPSLPLPDKPSEARLRALRRAVAAIDGEIASAKTSSVAADPLEATPPTPGRHFPLDVVRDEASPVRFDDAEGVESKQAPTAADGPSANAISIDGEYGFLEVSGFGLFEAADPFAAGLWVRPDAPGTALAGKTRLLLGNGGDKNTLWRGWEFLLSASDRLTLTLVSCAPDDRLEVATRARVPNGVWTHVAFSYDGSGRAEGVALYLNGRRQSVEVLDDRLTRSIHPVTNDEGFPPDRERRLRVGRAHRAFGGDDGIYRGGLDDVRLWSDALTDAEVAAAYDAYAAPGERATPSLGGAAWGAHRLARHNAPHRALLRDRAALVAMRVEIATRTPHVMVMRESAAGRQTHVLDRGAYDQPREAVEPDVPAALGELPDGTPRDRLGLAEWAFAPENPLAARVAANRYWRLVFGRGLVGTGHDFGLQGERPTHPELLDWLACELRDSGWDVRRLLRTLVLSQTYRQSSSPREWAAAAPTDSADPLEVDPENRLLWRAPARRLQAESLRDAALASSGLLVRKVGGPSAKPYQPPGLWSEKSTFSKALYEYQPDSGEGLYRRGMYTFIRRTSPPPAMQTFDAPNRSTCVVQRETTNTPLQALVLLNDPQFVEAARVAAEREILACDSTPEARVAGVYRRLVGWAPDEAERAPLVEVYRAALARYGASADEAAKLLAVGSHPRVAPDVPAAEAAALTVVANTVMNFDAFYLRR